MGDPFYGTARWKKKRALVLRRARYIDQLRKREGVNEEATTVHHIFRREEYPQYEWSDWNLIALSDRTHKAMHKPDGGLSDAGKRLMMETAAEQQIPIHETVLVIGQAGSGKSTYVKMNLGGGVVYDLDHIAAALRLKRPHEERNDAARRMAYDIGRNFAEAAKNYCGLCYIIRTAPTIDEVERIMPLRLVYCRRRRDIRSRADFLAYDEEAAQARIESVLEWATVNNIKVETYPPQ